TRLDNTTPRADPPTATSEPEPFVSPLPVELADIATIQHGVVTTQQCATAGLSPRQLVSLVAAGALRHPGRGLYIVSALEETEPEKRHRQLVAGALLLYPDAVLTGTTAVLAHGLPVWGAALDRPVLLRPIKRAGGMRAMWVRELRGTSVDTAWGPAAPVATALAQLAVDTGIVHGVVSADAALRTGATCTIALEAAVAEVRGSRHGSRAVAMLDLLDGRRESVGESRCGVALAMAGIDVEPQVRIRDDDGRVFARVDFLVRGTKVVVEFDGRVKYESGDPAVLWDEKRREDRLRRLGYVVVRVTWADLERPGAVAAKVRAALRDTSRMA
ncbi:MAG: type IV toxin-antitoxin system AbiEi family antitoxin domain-containing protein, partial [Dermatophilaceae bacterium]